MDALNSANQADRTRRFLRRVNVACTVVFVLLLPTTFFWGGSTALPLCLAFIAIIAAAQNARKKYRAGALPAAIVCGMVIVCIMATVGFLANGSRIMIGDGLAGTMDYDLGRSIGASFFAPFWSVPTLFGYDCSAGDGTNCSPALFWGSVALIEAIWAGGVVVGNVLAKRRLEENEVPTRSLTS